MVACYPQQGEVAHRLQEHRNRAHVPAESPVVLERVSQGDADGVVRNVSNDECPEHDLLDAAYMRQKKSGHGR